MSVDLSTNRNEIIDAWHYVLDPKNDIDWALYGYEGHSNVLRVVATGDGGLIELTDEWNSGKILYAFVGITNEQTHLTKYVLINWQGEGVQGGRKGVCANHIREIAKLLAGAHLTLNARNEDDIDSDRILEKLNSIRFAATEGRTIASSDEPHKVVGTNYSRVIPSKEINSKDRDNFWKKEEEEERVRIETERGRQINAKNEQEKEQRDREAREHEEREKKIVVDEPDKNTNGVQNEEIKNVQKSVLPTVDRSATQAEEMRQQRNQEARQLIGGSVNKAKAIFIQNTSSAAVGPTKTVKTAPAKPIRNSITRSTGGQNQQSPDRKSQHVENSIEIPPVINVEPIHVTPPEPATYTSHNNNGQISDVMHEPSSPQHGLSAGNDDDSDAYSTIKRSPYIKSNTNNNQEITPTPESKEIKSDNGAQPEELYANSYDDIVDENKLYQDMLQDEGIRARAIYDYQADDESEITFDPGDIISHIDKIDEGWWQGLGPDGTYGLFPANYVELLN